MRRAVPYLLAVAGVALTLGVVALLRTRFDLPTGVLLYLLPIIFAAARWGRGPAAVAAVVAALAHDYFFIAPVGTLNVAKLDEAVGLLLLLFTALATAQHAERVVTHGQLLRSVLGPGYEDAIGSLRVFITNLRKKLETDPSEPRLIVTEPGVGYRFKVD
jgi:K+-sensing histidine kinase KdpD